MTVTPRDAANMFTHTLVDFINNKQVFHLTKRSIENIRTELRLRHDQEEDQENERKKDMAQYIDISSLVGRGGKSSLRCPDDRMTYRASISKAKQGANRKVALRIGKALMEQSRLEAGDKVELLFDPDTNSGIIRLSQTGKGLRLSPIGNDAEDRKAKQGTYANCTIGFQWRKELGIPKSDTTVLCVSEVQGYEIHFIIPDEKD